MNLEWKKKSGIYKITDLESGKIYIGSTANCLYTRYHQHFSDLRKNKHGNGHLQAIYNKRSDSLKYELVEFCEKLECITREQYYIDLLKPQININKQAASRLGIKASEETLQKMKQRKVSEETRLLIKKARKLQVFTREQLEHRAQQVRNSLNKTIGCSTGQVFNSVQEASKQLKIPHSSISRILIGYTEFKNTRHKLNFWYITNNTLNKQ